MKLWIAVLIMVLVMTPVFILLGMCWQYTGNTILSIRGSNNTIELWQATLFVFVPVIGQLSIPAAALTWVYVTFFL